MAFLDKLNKMAKVIEDKTADAIEFSNYSAAITAGENGFAMDIKKIGEFYYEFYVNGGTVEPNILAVLQSAKAHQDSIAQAKADIERLNAEIAAEKEAVVIGIGTLLVTIIDFLLIALVIFLMIKTMAKAREITEKMKKEEIVEEVVEAE